MAAGTQNDTVLWQQVKQGDRSAFDLVYHRYAPPLFAMAYKHIRSRADAEDIIQEVFLDIWEKRMDITIQQSLFNYLYSAVRYRTLRYIKVNNARPESLDLFTELLNDQTGAATHPEVYTAGKIRSIDTSVAGEIAGLPEQMKKVYLLNTEEGMSIQEIAERLLISPHTVRNHLSKVRKRLRHVVSRLTSLFFSLLLSLAPACFLLF
ncbi:RNA polymerase sigma factor [Chitinophaga barathri]|uniref:Sigma-70 family RNA polymerase sigma factor n=1 Tax=Chitinophaga barathri TaxID=1647451 RepID=A0A3N4ME52_9BACT|nr:sigma-70 family RNA polymerase sigma factor [Chitinophaga barathri]RPD39877.1 sigma-70 family RNA polymerase sigma factor [Chitinophaga barathri]